jgi:tRNA-uridine 2-sulfurtransferase
MEPTRVIVAMSGGVDSAVAAARLVDEGHEVVGVTLHLWDYGDDGAPSSHGRCCAPEDQYDARRTADLLGFAHYTFDRRELFRKAVIDPFVDTYLAGETPSPCASCNRDVKLTILFELADRLGASKVATGHYARVVHDGDDNPFLAQGRDRTKDQSYFLYAARREQLERLVFPVGDSKKSEVRAEALARRLPGASKGESQELCFVGSTSAAYASFVEARANGRIRPGPIVDAEGRVVGAHAGVHRFTLGQRKGLGVAVGKPAFVTRIDPVSATVHLGDAGALASTRADVIDVALREGVDLPRRVSVRVRHGQVETPARIEVSGASGEIAVTFDQPVRAVSPGQIAVFYEDGRVLGGGRIARARAHAPSFPSASSLLRSDS